MRYTPNSATATQRSGLGHQLSQVLEVREVLGPRVIPGVNAHLPGCGYAWHQPTTKLFEDAASIPYLEDATDSGPTTLTRTFSGPAASTSTVSVSGCPSSVNRSAKCTATGPPANADSSGDAGATRWPAGPRAAQALRVTDAVGRRPPQRVRPLRNHPPTIEASRPGGHPLFTRPLASMQ